MRKNVSLLNKRLRDNIANDEVLALSNLFSGFLPCSLDRQVEWLKKGEIQIMYLVSQRHHVTTEDFLAIMAFSSENTLFGRQKKGLTKAV